MEPKINIYNDAFKTAEEFTKYFIKLINSITEKNDTAAVLLSGGSTPKLFFQILSDNKDKIKRWQNIHFYWGDERCVAPDDSDSNYLMTKENLFDNIQIPDANIHRIKGENEPGGESIRYSEEIKTNIRSVNNLPQFDITILGLGTDGHTASIFPDKMELLTSENICEVAVHPESGQKRITVTGKILNNSEHILFLATGQNKAEKIASILNKKGNYKSFPVSYIFPISNNLTYFIDKSAAKNI
ncbi:MAG: 6-phosphogluconolactonase [Melioribacteraceae bacterium]|nr:6-phosphogluconolactonase [Melioribacteraceae bacterium]